MQITHEEARKLIQYNADAQLSSQKKAVLFAHLKDCVDCRVYAKELKEVESILAPAMNRHWNLQPIPLCAHVIASRRNSKLQASILLATRTALVALVFMAFAFTFWQFTLPSRPGFGHLPTTVLPVPTPSTQSTSTKILFQNCEMIIYEVKENDTLERLASQFSTSKEEIIAINQLKTETIIKTMELIIPICESTPTGTVYPAKLTTTYTPAFHQITSTPGGESQP